MKKKKKKKVYNTALRLYNECLRIYFDEYNSITDAEKKEIDKKYDSTNLFLKEYDYDKWYEDLNYKKEESDNSTLKDKEKIDDIPPMPPGDEEEVKERKGLKVLTQNKLLTRFPVLLVQIKVINNSYKLKNEIRQTLHLLYQHNKITKKLYNNLIKSL